MLQGMDLGHAQEFLLSDIDDKEDSTMTMEVEEDSAKQQSEEMRQGTARGSDVPAAEAYSNVDSSDEVG